WWPSPPSARWWPDASSAGRPERVSEPAQEVGVVVRAEGAGRSGSPGPAGGAALGDAEDDPEQGARVGGQGDQQRPRPLGQVLDPITRRGHEVVQAIDGQDHGDEYQEDLAHGASVPTRSQCRGPIRPASTGPGPVGLNN